MESAVYASFNKAKKLSAVLVLTSPRAYSPMTVVDRLMSARELLANPPVAIQFVSMDCRLRIDGSAE